jgi:hypothetical protein
VTLVVVLGARAAVVVAVAAGVVGTEVEIGVGRIAK